MSGVVWADSGHAARIAKKKSERGNWEIIPELDCRIAIVRVSLTDALKSLRQKAFFAQNAASAKKTKLFMRPMTEFLRWYCIFMR